MIHLSNLQLQDQLYNPDDGEYPPGDLVGLPMGEYWYEQQ